MGAVLVIGLVHALDGHEGFGLLGRAGGDIDHPAHRIAGIAGRVGAIDHVELRNLARADHAPFGRIGKGVAQEVGDREAIHHDQRPGALGGMRAAKAGDAVGIAGVAGAHEEVGCVFHQVFDVAGIDARELFVAEADGKAAGFQADGRVALADDEDGRAGRRIGILGKGCPGKQGKRRRAEREQESVHGDIHLIGRPSMRIGMRASCRAAGSGPAASHRDQAGRGGPLRGGRICARRRRSASGRCRTAATKTNSKAAATSAGSTASSAAAECEEKAQG